MPTYHADDSELQTRLLKEWEIEAFIDLDMTRKVVLATFANLTLSSKEEVDLLVEEAFVEFHLQMGMDFDEIESLLTKNK